MRGVDCDCEPVREYAPEKGRGNRHAKGNWGWFIAFALGCSIPVIVTQLIGAFYLWPNDPYVELKWLSKTFLKLFIAVVCAEGYLVYKDWRLNGNLFKGIIQSPWGCAFFAGACIYSIVLVCISSIL